MKLLFPANILAGAALLAGCISQQRELVLEPVGPLNVNWPTLVPMARLCYSEA